MFFTAMPEPSRSSVWKLSLMTLGVVAASMALMLLLMSWALHRSFDDVGRAVIEDDLGEYRLTYEQGGIEAVRNLFGAGGHDEHDQILRVVDASGSIRLDVLLPNDPQVSWPDLSRSPSPTGDEIQWFRHSLKHGPILTVGRRRLADGAELWFGRTDAADIVAIDRVHRLILFAMLITAVLSVGPVMWFASRVLRPVRSLIVGARRLARGESLEHRLEASAAIPEIEQFANVFNASLDRVQLLTEELQAANDQLAHELRTPLARIRGNVESILKHGDDSSTVREDAARAIDEIKRATALIQSILSIRAGDSGAMILELETRSLTELVSETCSLYSAAAEEKDLDFKLLINTDSEPVEFDRQRLQQALCNLLDNAIAYTPPLGKVRVEVSFEEAHAVIRVRDTGPGLSDADPQNIWRRFVRGSAVSAKTPGIGLGLSLVKAVVTAHRGETGVENRPEGGAEFWMKIPVAQS